MRPFSIPILTYHQIADAPRPGTPFSGLVLTPGSFRRQMKLLSRLGYTGCSIAGLWPYLHGEKIGKVFGITFDDGYRNVYLNALPVLHELGFTATNYFVSRQVGGSNEWDRSIGIPESECMNAEELRRWSAFGNEVGAHTLDHVPLTQIPEAEAYRQIADCRRELEDLSGGSVSAFCYPYGNFDMRVRDMVEEAGYSTATTIRKARVTPSDDPFLLPRVMVRRRDMLPAFWSRMIFAPH